MSRSTLAATLAVAAAAAFGCSTQITVVDPPPPTTGPTTAPVFNGAANQAATAPLPVSGGTLLAITKSDGSAMVLAADPDEDVINVVALGAKPTLLGFLQLDQGDQPGRMVADASGRVHVVLRGGGGIATILPNATGAALVSRRAVCSAPRGIDYNPATDSVIVACATGEVASLPAAGGAMTALVDTQTRNLRDVVVDGSSIFVTRFRAAEVITLNPDFTINTSNSPNINTLSGSPTTAWRAVKNPNGGVVMVFQISSLQPIDVATPPGVSSYGGQTTITQPQPINGGAGGVVVAAVANVGGSGSSYLTPQALASNPVVDLAVGPNGVSETVSISGTVEMQGGSFDLDAGSAEQPNTYVAIADAQKATIPYVIVQSHGATPALVILPALNGMVNSSNPITIKLQQTTSHSDTGFDVFHQPASKTGSIACMNCHPEGGDDGHTWQFQLATETRARRTQSLRGGVISGSAPYHWDGDMPDLQFLCNEVFTHRMGGGSMLDKQTQLLERFVNALPRVPVKATLNPDSVAKGMAIFNGAAGCSGCHVNGTGTLPSNQDIGKYDAVSLGNVPLQVPMLLGVADRAPYMHDGCAATLLDRLTVNDCSGTKHGNTTVVSALSADDKSNLVTYLESL